MRCPKCGRYSSVQIQKRHRGKEVVSVCSTCGEINVYSENSVENISWSFDTLKIFLIILAIIFAGASIYFSTKARTLRSQALILDEQYTELIDDYLSLLNISDTLRDYYDITRANYSELQTIYQDLRKEYSDLLILHSSSIQENVELTDQISHLNIDKRVIQKELNDILSFSKDEVIDNKTRYVILPGGNTTISYDVIYAGYIKVNFSSTTDIFMWIGSPISENTYYYRFPVFPQTAFNGTYNVPVSHEVFLYIENTNVVESCEIIITVEYIY